jgi:hypothetical protein
VAPVKNMEEVFVLHPVLNKNLSRFFKIISIFPESASEDKVLNRKKTSGFEFFGRVVLER